jgi:hypothetical protein
MIYNTKINILTTITIAIITIILLSANTNAATGGVTITNRLPNTTNAIYNPTLSATITDSNNNPLTVYFKTNMSGEWETIGTYTGGNGEYSHQTTGMDIKDQKYYWRIEIFDGTTTKISNLFSFTAKPFITKWTYNQNAKTHNGPLAADINNDGIYEIFSSGIGKVVALNGLTGELLWEYRNSRISVHSPIEIADLNNDGIPNLVVPASDRTIALNTNDGSVLWEAMFDSGNKYPLILDTDGNKLPYVYVAYGDHFFGNGRIRKLKGTDGTLVAETQVWYPCFSGLSATDANNDGKFEIYMCDRKAGYEGPEGLGKGMQAYSADDLSLIWYEGAVTCSSHLISHIDINNDQILDSIALPQSGNGGIYVIDGQTMKKMTGKWSDNLFKSDGVIIGTHSPPSIYDFDLNGNIELITSREGPATVWDLNTWSLDAQFNEYNFSEPPRFADVIGDEKLEIIGITGDIRIYDHQYQLIESITGSNPIAATIVQDIDNDGKNELIVISFAGLITVYDTSAYTPEKRVRTNTQLFSEKRLGAAVYEPLSGPLNPVIKEIMPVNTAINTPLNPELSARVVDFRYDLLDVEISTNVSGEWEVVASFNDEENRWFSYQPENMNEFDTTYYWKVRAVDSNADNKVTEQIMSFTTLAQKWGFGEWEYRKPIIINHNKISGDLSNFTILIDITDSDIASKAQEDGDDLFFTSIDGNKLAHEISSYDPSTGHIVAWVKMPFVSSEEDNSIYVYYGNEVAENQENPSEVWDSNYLAVHHFDEIEGNQVFDSTTNNNDGTTENVLMDTSGIVNGADEFLMNNSITSIPKIFSNENQFSFESWIYVEEPLTNIQAILSQRDDSKRGALLQYENSTGTLIFMVNDKSTSKIPLGGSYGWHYIVGTYDGKTATLYRDNYSITSSVAVSAVDWPEMNVYAGNRNAKNRLFSGKLDEIRISNIARSPQYIKTVYNNINNPQEFVSIGVEEEKVEGIMGIVNQNPNHLSTNVPFTTSEISFEIFNNDNTPMSYVFSSTPDIGSDSKNDLTNGIYSVPVSGLLPDKEYKWEIILSDGTKTINKEYNFRTVKSNNLELISFGSGTIESSCLLCNANSEVTIEAIPEEGWEFIGWHGGKIGYEIEGTENPLTFKITDNTIVRAMFREIGSSLIADSTFDASIDYNDLIADSIEQDWYESRTPGATGGDPTLLSINTENIGNNFGKKIKLSESPLIYDPITNTSSYVGNAYLTQEFITPQPQAVSLTFDIYVESIKDYYDVDRAGHILVGTDNNDGRGPNSGEKERFLLMGFYHLNGTSTPGDNISLIAQELEDPISNSSQWKVIADDLKIGEWYTIRLDINVISKNYDVYVNGTLKAEDVETLNPLVRSLTHISFGTWNDGPGTFYLDNVRESTELICLDYDNDGYGENCALGNDCNDNDANINPEALEFCDGIDNNCDLIIDQDSEGRDVCEATNVYCDNDSDNHISSTVSELCFGFNCVAPEGCSLIAGYDCNDDNAEINPEADDNNCNSIDENCDGIADNGFIPELTNCGLGVCASTGYSSCNNGQIISNCEASEPLSSTDSNCNNIDDNCNGIIDEDYIYTGEAFFCGIGACKAQGTKVCIEGTETESCTPGEPTEEFCDGIDNNCNNETDENDVCLATHYYCDFDNDTYLSSSVSGVCDLFDCEIPTECSENAGTDCDDNNTNIHPEANDSSCNNIDENCNGLIDEEYVPYQINCQSTESCELAPAQMICVAGIETNTCPLPFEPNCIDTSCNSDGVCNNEETCSTCATDCGSCPVVTPPRRSGGGGGGGSSSTTNWDCKEWSECVNGKQTQECSFGYSKKTNTQSCTVKPVEKTVLPTVSTTLDNKESVNNNAPVITTIDNNEESLEAAPTVEESAKGNEITGFATNDGSKNTKTNIGFIIAGIVLVVGALGVLAYFKLRKKN